MNVSFANFTNPAHVSQVSQTPTMATPVTATANPQTATTTPNPENVLTQQFENLIGKFGNLFSTIFDGTVNSAVQEMAQQVMAQVAKNKEILVKENIVGKLSGLLGETQKLLSSNKGHIEEVLARFIQVAKEVLAQKSPFIHLLRTGLAADPQAALKSLYETNSGAASPNNVSTTLPA